MCGPVPKSSPALQNGTRSLKYTDIIHIFYNLSGGPPIAPNGHVEGLFTRDNADAPSTPLHSKATILVVDDEPLVRSMLESVLTRHGCSVLAASCGHEAIEL